MTVEKSAKETWQFEVSKDTKGMPKVGDKVTVYYKMVATEIEASRRRPRPPPEIKFSPYPFPRILRSARRWRLSGECGGVIAAWNMRS